MPERISKILILLWMVVVNFFFYFSLFPRALEIAKGFLGG